MPKLCPSWPPAPLEHRLGPSWPPSLPPLAFGSGGLFHVHFVLFDTKPGIGYFSKHLGSPCAENILRPHPGTRDMCCYSAGYYFQAFLVDSQEIYFLSETTSWVHTDVFISNLGSYGSSFGFVQISPLMLRALVLTVAIACSNLWSPCDSSSDSADIYPQRSHWGPFKICCHSFHPWSWP